MCSSKDEHLMKRLQRLILPPETRACWDMSTHRATLMNHAYITMSYQFDVGKKPISFYLINHIQLSSLIEWMVTVLNCIGVVYVFDSQQVCCINNSLLI